MSGKRHYETGKSDAISNIRKDLAAAETWPNCNPCHFKSALESFFYITFTCKSPNKVVNIDCVYLLSDGFVALTEYLGEFL